MYFESWICSLYGMWGIVNNLCVGMVARRSRLDVCSDIRFISTDIIDLAQSPATQPIFIVYLAQYVFVVNQINTSDTFVRKPD